MRSRERRPFDELHDERHDAVALFQAVDVRNVRVVQRREDFCLAVKASEAFGVRCERVGQDLDGDLPLQLGVRRSIHLAHSAHADLGGDFVRAEASAWGERHVKQPEPRRL